MEEIREMRRVWRDWANAWKICKSQQLDDACLATYMTKVDAEWMKKQLRCT